MADCQMASASQSSPGLTMAGSGTGGRLTARGVSIVVADLPSLLAAALAPSASDCTGLECNKGKI